MGSRAHGTWARLYADVWSHPKTMALAKGLESLGVPSRWSVDVAVGQLHRLACGLADSTDDGKLGHLAPQAFCNLIGWSDHRKADAVLAAWMSSGFIDEPWTSVAGLHDFHEMFAELIRKRESRRAAKSRTTAGQRPPDGRTKSARRPDNGRTTAAETLSLSHPPLFSPSHSPSISPPAPSPSSHSDLPTVGRLSARADDTASADWLAEAWREINPRLPQPMVPVRGQVRESLNAAAKRDPSRLIWRDRFAKVAASDWLSGRSGDFRASLLWATGPKNTAKIDAGNYESHTATAPAQRIDRTTQLVIDANALYERSLERGNAAEPLAIDEA